MKDIRGYEGLYAVDEQGVIWSLNPGRGHRKGPLKPQVNTGGYLRVNLYKDGRARHHYVHRLVAEAFVPNPMEYKVVNHLDSNPQNNQASNLEWCEQKDNIRYSREQGRQKKDLAITATNTKTREQRQFSTIKAASQALFGCTWALEYVRRRQGDRFSKGGWDFEVHTA